DKFRVELLQRGYGRDRLNVGHIAVADERGLLHQRSRRQHVAAGTGSVKGAEITLPHPVAAVEADVVAKHRIVDATAQANVQPAYEAAAAIHCAEIVAEEIAAHP